MVVTRKCKFINYPYSSWSPLDLFSFENFIWNSTSNRIHLWNAYKSFHFLSDLDRLLIMTFPCSFTRICFFSFKTRMWMTHKCHVSNAKSIESTIADVQKTFFFMTEVSEFRWTLHETSPAGGVTSSNVTCNEFNQEVRRNAYCELVWPRGEPDQMFNNSCHVLRHAYMTPPA
jgi:hypothetical protein